MKSKVLINFLILLLLKGHLQSMLLRFDQIFNGYKVRYAPFDIVY